MTVGVVVEMNIISRAKRVTEHFLMSLRNWFWQKERNLPALNRTTHMMPFDCVGQSRSTSKREGVLANSISPSLWSLPEPISAVYFRKIKDSSIRVRSNEDKVFLFSFWCAVAVSNFTRIKLDINMTQRLIISFYWLVLELQSNHCPQVFKETLYITQYCIL